MKRLGIALALATAVAAATPSAASATTGDLSTTAKVNGCGAATPIAPGYYGPAVVGEQVGSFFVSGTYMYLGLSYGRPSTLYTITYCRDSGGPITLGTFKTGLAGSGFWQGTVGAGSYYRVTVTAAGPGAVGSAAGWFYKYY